MDKILYKLQSTIFNNNDHHVDIHIRNLRQKCHLHAATGVMLFLH